MNSILQQALSGPVLLCAFFTVQLTSLSAQTSESPTISFEAKTSYHGQNPTQFTYFRSEDGEEDILLAFIAKNQLALGFGLRKINLNGWYSRYSLMQLSLADGSRSVRKIGSRSDIVTFTDGEKVKSFNLRMRFERGKYFALGERFQLGMGALVDPFIVFSRADPLLPEAFPVSNVSTGLETGIVPQLTYRFSDRVGIYLEVPVVLLRAAYTATKLDNPFITETRRTTGTFTVDAVANVQAGFGFQVSL